MSQEFARRGLLIIILSFIFVSGIFSRYDETNNLNRNQQKYLPFISSSLFLACLFAVAISGFIYGNVQESLQLVLSVCFSVFLHICFYYGLLLMLLPLFRKCINARTCALLWVLPNFLYIMFYNYMEIKAPLFIIQASKTVVWILAIVWSIGFISVISGNLISHWKFRTIILDKAMDVTDSEILKLWNQELDKANMKYRKYRLVFSSEVQTPLTIGLVRRWICVVLPAENFSNEELELIFRHEIVHIGREDVWTKFFLVFCTAMCWFNPMMWFAMKKTAEDLELSCDETVLINETAEKRRKYAELILSRAGNERGFTTCLSASAKALRYRLKNILTDKQRATGAILVGVILWIMSMSCGYIALAYGEYQGKELIYQNGDVNSYEIGEMYYIEKDGKILTGYKCVNPEAFHAYLSELSMYKITGRYTFSDRGKELHYYYEIPNGTIFVSLSDNIIELTMLQNGNANTVFYYLPEGIDWKTLEKTIIFFPSGAEFC